MKISVSLLVVALVVSGCAGRPTVHGVKFRSDGSIVNESGRALHGVTIDGELWTMAEKLELCRQRVGDWSDGEVLKLGWRVELVDRIDVVGRCREGKFYCVFPVE